MCPSTVGYPGCRHLAGTVYPRAVVRRKRGGLLVHTWCCGNNESGPLVISPFNPGQPPWSLQTPLSHCEQTKHNGLSFALLAEGAYTRPTLLQASSRPPCPLHDIVGNNYICIKQCNELMIKKNVILGHLLSSHNLEQVSQMKLFNL